MGEVIELDTRALLVRWRAGDMGARNALFAAFYPDLRRAAAAMLRGERGCSLSTGDLVQESVARLVALNRIDWADATHFKALSATMMRRALLDHVRARRTDKRRHEKVELLTGVGIGDPDYEIEALSAALEALGRIDPERAEIVEMRYFGGLEIGEIALVLGCSEATVKRRWTAARLWLLAELSDA